MARDMQKWGPWKDPVHGVEGPYFVSSTILGMGQQESIIPSTASVVLCA